MNDDIVKLAKELRDEIGKARQLHDSVDVNGIFQSAEKIIGIRAYLISPIALLEQRYRQIIAQYISEGDSVAKAEARAKATDDYMEWRKYEELRELGLEQSMLLKKMATRLQGEWQGA